MTMNLPAQILSPHNNEILAIPAAKQGSPDRGFRKTTGRPHLKVLHGGRDIRLDVQLNLNHSNSPRA